MADGADDNPLTEHRLRSLEELIKALGPGVAQGASTSVKVDDLAESFSTFRDDVKSEFRLLRTESATDRRESRNRTLLALGPIALAALAIAAKVLFGVELHA